MHLDEIRKRAPRERSPIVPDEAIDACEESFKAAKGDGAIDTDSKFDDHGLVVLACRHDIPLFYANLDTPGEQQKYAVALLYTLFGYLPPSATVVCLYDIGCTLDRSFQKVSKMKHCVDLSQTYLVVLPTSRYRAPSRYDVKCYACIRTSVGLSNLLQSKTP